MKITNRYTKTVSTKEQPKKDIEGYVYGSITSLGIETKTKFGQPALQLSVNLDGENGGSIKQILFYDLIFTKSKKGLTKLPATMQRLEILDDSELEMLLSLEEFEVSDLREYLMRFNGLRIKFKTTLRNDRFAVDYDSVKLESAPSSFIVLI